MLFEDYVNNDEAGKIKIYPKPQNWVHTSHYSTNIIKKVMVYPTAY